MCELSFQIIMLTISLIQILQPSSAECTYYYYTLLKTAPGTTEIKIAKLTEMFRAYPMNTTEEYNIIQKNIDCVLELECNDDENITECEVQPEIKPLVPTVISKTNATATAEYITNSTNPNKLNTPTDNTTYSSTETPTTKSTVSTEKTTKIISTTDAAATREYISSSTNAITTLNTPTDSTIYTTETTTTKEDETTTAMYYQEAMRSEEKEYGKIAAIAIGTLVGGFLLIFLAKQALLPILQSGTYHIPDSNTADTRV